MVGALLDRLERLLAPALRLLRCLRQPVRLLEETIDRARAEERVTVGVVHRHAALLAAVELTEEMLRRNATSAHAETVIIIHDSPLVTHDEGDLSLG